MNKIFAFAVILLSNLIGLSFINLNAQNCVNNIDAGADETICAPGAVTLSGTSDEIPLSTSWSPTTGLTDPGSLVTSANINNTTTFQLSVTALSTINLIENGDFSQGDLGFTSDYIPGTGGGVGLLSNEGQYAIADNAGDTHNHFDNCNDHTGGGNMMVVNGSGNPDNVWCQTVIINPNASYFFGAWATSVVSQNPADLQFSVNGNLLGTVFNAPSSTCNWNEFTTSWFSGPNTFAEICIANVNDDPAGNDFAIDDIYLYELCESTDEVTITLAELNATFVANTAYCQDEAAFDPNVLLTPLATAGGAWTIDGQSIATFDPSSLSVGNHTLLYTLVEGPCQESIEQIIEINANPNAGTPQDAPSLCEGESIVFNLTDLLDGEDSGGTWEEISNTPSSAGAFDALAGTFNTDGQVGGTYIFRYEVSAVAPCANDESTVTIEINALPTADAGEDLSLGCGINEVSIGGSGTSTNGNYSYTWVSMGGSPIVDPSMPFTEVQKADTYILTVTDLDSGCSSTDEVTITANVNNVVASGTSTSLSCFGENDGSISVTDVSGGTAPYSYALNDGVFGTSSLFENLGAGAYTVTVRDVNGCETTVDFIIEDAQELTVQIISNANSDPPIINLGEFIQLEALVNKPVNEIALIEWTGAVDTCANCLTITQKPQNNTTYTVTITDISGCVAEASLLVSINREVRAFIPNAFSPNSDGVNDEFRLYPGNENIIVRSFRVLNRWGDLVFDYSDTNQSIPTADIRWDGTFQGKKLNPGVFIYAIEVELSDGETVVLSGDVALLY